MTVKTTLSPEEAELVARLRAAADQRQAARDALARMSPGEYVRRREELLQHIETGRRQHERTLAAMPIAGGKHARDMSPEEYRAALASIGAR